MEPEKFGTKNASLVPTAAEESTPIAVNMRVKFIANVSKMTNFSQPAEGRLRPKIIIGGRS